jgi:uncharacterized protein (TIGR01777 family)
MKITIVGGSGFIGTKLSEALLEKGYSVTSIDLVPPRITHERLSFVRSNIAEGTSSPQLIDGSFAVVNLAGATIGRRWNASYRKLIYTSRIDTTRALVRMISRCAEMPKVLVSASAVGYYGNRDTEVLSEDAGSGTDFLANLCVNWEQEAAQAEAFGVRVVRIRTANVLGPGGLLTTLEPLFKRWLGGYFGRGSQYMPWVHWKDIVGIYVHAIEQPLSGAFNAGAGETPTQKELFRAFAQILHSPILWPVPYLAARLMFGGFADALVASQNTSSEKIRASGYLYQYEHLPVALEDLYPARKK